MLFGIDTNIKFSENLNSSEMRELMKPTTTYCLLTGTLRMGTVMKKKHLCTLKRLEITIIM